MRVQQRPCGPGKKVGIIILQLHHILDGDLVHGREALIDALTAVQVKIAKIVIRIGAVCWLLVGRADKSSFRVLYMRVLYLGNVPLPGKGAVATGQNIFALVFPAQGELSVMPEGYLSGFGSKYKVLCRTGIMLQGIQVLFIIPVSVQLQESEDLIGMI